MVDLWPWWPIQKLWQIFISISVQIFTFFWHHQIFLLFLFPPTDLFNCKMDLNWKNHRGPFFSTDGPARLCLGPIQRTKLAHTVCFLKTLPSRTQRLTDPTRQPHSFAGGNCYAPDPLWCPVSSQTHPLSSALASRCSLGQFQSTGRPRAVPQRCPTKSPWLRRPAPSRTETSPCTTAHVCRCRARIVATPSELRLSD
jgi:hypothetical protein